MRIGLEGLLEWRLDKLCDKREKIGPAKLSHSRTYIRSLLRFYLWKEFFFLKCVGLTIFLTRNKMVEFQHCIQWMNRVGIQTDPKPMRILMTGQGHRTEWYTDKSKTHEGTKLGQVH